MSDYYVINVKIRLIYLRFYFNMFINVSYIPSVENMLWQTNCS